MRGGKGTRIAVSAGVLDKIVSALTQAQELYVKCDSPEAFMEALELEEESHTNYKRGNTEYNAHNKYIVINTGGGEQFRMTFSLTDKGQFTLDFRGWFTPAGMG